MSPIYSHRGRLEACLAGELPDHTPVSFWRHFPVDDRSAGGLAAATLAFQRLHDLDLVKVTPQSAYCLEDWGSTAEWRGAAEGTCAYTRRVIQQPEDWLKLPALNPLSGRLGVQLECLRLLRRELGHDTPILQTIFNPLSQAKNLAGGETLLVHLRRFPEAVLAGLQTIAETTRRFIDVLSTENLADGVFYAVQHAQFGLLSESEYRHFGRSFDLELLESARPLWLNMLHLHGLEVMFDLFCDYPVQAINWHDRETAPSLRQALERFPGVLCGGLQRDQTMLLGSPETVLAEASAAIQSTQGRRFILGTGCVTMTTTPFGNYQAALAAARTWRA